MDLSGYTIDCYGVDEEAAESMPDFNFAYWLLIKPPYDNHHTAKYFDWSNFKKFLSKTFGSARSKRWHLHTYPSNAYVYSHSRADLLFRDEADAMAFKLIIE